MTGASGFKGSWLSIWLNQLGAEVLGVSNGLVSNPNLFEVAQLSDFMDHKFIDIRNLDALKKTINNFKPDFVFHLAAQPIVSEAYRDPLFTISTNVMGTANILECLRHIEFKCAAVVITSDKCYENVEQLWGYKETDRLGGKDIYSASKACSELIFSAYFRSILFQNDNLKLATARAGNVIGGGDWAKDRVIVDTVKSWAKGEEAIIRNPRATRPWQHVLEPLSGYLYLAARLIDNQNLNGQSFNFGPNTNETQTVEELVKLLSSHWKSNKKASYSIKNNTKFYEAKLLKLNIEKANELLNWQPTLNFLECVASVGDWYSRFYDSGSECNMLDFTREQIDIYLAKAREKNIKWTD